ncbi:DUF4262 domain-containing protein [Tessaracoccus sp.]
MSDPFDEYDQKILDLIHEHGWAIQGVFPTKPGDGAGFAYTVGLSGLPAPELIIVGLPPEVAQGILNDIAATVRDGKRWRAGDRSKDFVVGGLELAFIDVDDTSEHLGVANRTYPQAAPVPALQVVWPDTHGRFPWEPSWGMGPTVQPLYGTPPTP